jgi:hypothetical protein
MGKGSGQTERSALLLAEPYNGITSTLSTAGEKLIRNFELLGEALNHHQGRDINDGWSCDQGAIALLALAEERGTESIIRSGLYWHPHLRAYTDTIGEVYNPDNYFQAPQDPAEEHHHWLEFNDQRAGWVLIDPNGQVRGEPRVQPRDQAYDIGHGYQGHSRYEVLSEGDQWCLISPRATFTEILDREHGGYKSSLQFVTTWLKEH